METAPRASRKRGVLFGASFLVLLLYGFVMFLWTLSSSWAGDSCDGCNPASGFWYETLRDVWVALMVIWILSLAATAFRRPDSD
jgi:hypothetical protein